MERPSVAMLIDWENIKRSTITCLHCPPDIITLKKIARRQGGVSTARAYANWADMQHEFDMETFAEQDIEPVYVKTKVYRDGDELLVKGSADLKMACDGMELLFKAPGLSTFVLVTGDGGFVHLVSKLKAYGKKAVAVGVRATMAAHLAALCDEVVWYDEWISGIKFGTLNDRIRDALIRFETAVTTIQRMKGDNTLRGIKAHIRKFADARFEEEDMGLPTFRHLAFLAEREGRVRIDGTVSPARGYGAEEEVTVQGEPLYSKKMWEALICGLQPNIPYQKRSLQEFLHRTVDLGDEAALESFVQNARRSGVLWSKNTKYSVTAGKTFDGLEFFLNPSNPRVQAYQKFKDA